MKHSSFLRGKTKSISCFKSFYKSSLRFPLLTFDLVYFKPLCYVVFIYAFMRNVLKKKNKIK